jgi:hypothetical protein
MIPLQVDPDWYERRWYANPPRRPGLLARLRALALMAHRAWSHAALRVDAKAAHRPLTQAVSQTQSS